MTHHDGAATFAPATAEIVVPVDPATAFGLYVRRPGRTHPAAGQWGDRVEIVYEPFDGGRWFERGADGSETDWGQVVHWDPPRRLVLAWMVGDTGEAWAYDPDPNHASRAEIAFEPIWAGTRVRVIHTGFERHGGGAASIRRGVETGWVADLADLARAASEQKCDPTT